MVIFSPNFKKFIEYIEYLNFNIIIFKYYIIAFLVLLVFKKYLNNNINVKATFINIFNKNTLE